MYPFLAAPFALTVPAGIAYARDHSVETISQGLGEVPAPKTTLQEYDRTRSLSTIGTRGRTINQFTLAGAGCLLDR